MQTAARLDSKPRVGIVDDSKAILKWMEKSLSPLGFEVATLCGAFGVQAFVRSFQPDILLLDVNMPALNGPTICKMLRSNDATRSLRIVFHSTVEEPTLEQLSRENGADGFIRKHNDATRLAAQIRAAIAR